MFFQKESAVFDGSVMSAMVTGGFALMGGVCTVCVTHLFAIEKRKGIELRKELALAYKDIAAYHNLEYLYAVELSRPNRSTDAIKRDYRRRLRRFGYDVPAIVIKPTITDRV